MYLHVYVCTALRAQRLVQIPENIFDILQANRVANDPYGFRRVKLPETYAGKLIVFKVTPRVSFGLVMSINEPVHQFDKVTRPVAGRR